MNTIKSTLIAFAIGLLLFSCDPSRDDAPTTPVARLNMMIDLKSSPSGRAAIKNHNMNDAASFIYVLHDADKGTFLKTMNAPQDAIKEHIKNGVAGISDFLPFGNYYVTLIVTTKTKVENTTLKALNKPYTEAICQLPNEHIYYNTYKVDCTPTDQSGKDIVRELKATLDRITGEFVLQASDMASIPAAANFSIVTQVKDVPSAIFISSGRTLNDEDGKEDKIEKYSNTITIDRSSPSPLSSTLATVFLLENDHIATAQRGTLKMVYKEDKTSATATKEHSQAMPQANSTIPWQGVTVGLY